LARASALHAEGHRFDSDILHHHRVKKGIGDIEDDYSSSFRLVLMKLKVTRLGVSGSNPRYLQDSMHD
jgi:hypothetical protein